MQALIGARQPIANGITVAAGGANTSIGVIVGCVGASQITGKIYGANASPTVQGIVLKPCWDARMKKGCVFTSGSAVVVMSNVDGLAAGQTIYGAPLASLAQGTTILSVDATARTITMSANASATETRTLFFAKQSGGINSLAADWAGSGSSMQIAEDQGYPFTIYNPRGIITIPGIAIQLTGNAGASPANDVTLVSAAAWPVYEVGNPRESNAPGAYLNYNMPDVGGL